MFQVIRSENRLVRLVERRFSDLGLREREHLQEWLAHMPEALGEELLVIQKEFDGFADTRERLDLLALDREGRLVVVENKLDDSGRDVVWQALKYAAYCSNLTPKDIRAIYQKHLDRSPEGGDADANLRDFLGVEDLDEAVLNPRNEQRLVLVAASFRKEVTAAVLWLLGHGVRAQCFRVVPYSFREEVFVDLQQIIPTPETADYMIGMAAKDSEQKAVEGARRSGDKVRRAFWTQVLEALRERDTTLFQNVNPSGQYWLSCSTGLSGCDYSLLFAKKEVRVEVELKRSKGENKWLFDRLEQQRADVEADFGEGLNWLRMDDKKASRIVFARDFDGFDEANWPDMVDWLCEHILRLEQAFSEPLGRLNRQLKSGIDQAVAGGAAAEGLAAAD
ncbi:MAG: DUF4268 domain-containing protein [Gammaproteobacteria bacterium]|nr:DUF4268 domain-containing protein [Gammaproteobacteria bacterium]